MANSYPNGATVRVYAQTKDVNGQLADATLVTITITKPDATTSTPGVTHASLGTYYADVATTAAGTWAYAGVSTGLITVGSGSFTVV